MIRSIIPPLAVRLRRRTPLGRGGPGVLVDRVECTQIGITMSRFVRQLLFGSLIACHAAVTLYGPCLHDLAGSSHSIGATSKGHLPGAPAQSSRDTTDGCLICHFFAQ